MQSLPKAKQAESLKICQLHTKRNDRLGAPGGGTAVYYKRKLYCCPIDIPPLLNLKSSAYKLAVTGHGTLIIDSVYLSPKKWLLRSDIETLLALGDAVILIDDIVSYNNIDTYIGALTKHIRSVVKRCQRKVPANSDRGGLPADVLELIRVKYAVLHHASAYPASEYRSRARALHCEVKTSVKEDKNENWSTLMDEITPNYKIY
ncbi:hypothetical protein EVAR_93145_1 [Eumeta japonica]|uniref:Uncharacterized protein n=1 Tax=Eumeta variegata TaxID=151549 RepID=A0A4C1TFE2_EUMVA|nr:hypothetical protein EVAR_93145_1 [Eumeta japonica]